MMPHRLPSLSQLKRAVKLAAELEKLQKELDALCAGQGSRGESLQSPRRVSRRTSYSLSPQGSKLIAEAQRKRWANFRLAKQAASKKG
jgi:hypothetical protein